MTGELAPRSSLPALPGGLELPAIVERSGKRAARRFIEFFAAGIRNPNTRDAYARSVRQFFDWLDAQRPSGADLSSIEPLHVAAYIEELSRRGLPSNLAWHRRQVVGRPYSAPAVKQHLAAIRMLFDWLVTGGVLPMNPASSVKGPRYSVTKGLTPVLSEDEAKQLFASIATDSIAGLRDRALLGVMTYTFARVGAVVGMNVEDYYEERHRRWLRFHEKNGKLHAVPAHHKVVDYLEAYLDASGLRRARGAPLFRTLDRTRALSPRRIARAEVLQMVKRRARGAGLSPERVRCHTFRATGITNFIERGGTVEKAQQIAAHSDVRTTKLYDRSNDELSLDEIERISI